ncbi:MAG TPA: glycoside hydrolase family 44 protein [Tepidisphaeraceae bacterium]|jgi:hypothetical protein|nr:glycoside hydrolase family 44 protein [Tepidisphaeraceae bacterium]
MNHFPTHRSTQTLTLLTFAAITLLPTPAPAQTTATINGTLNVKPISPLIYGSNSNLIPSTSDRLGGNRWTAYNWENNASNAGSDYIYQNDNYLVDTASAANQAKPGYAVLPTLQSAAAGNRATILTIPMAGYVAADKNEDGDVHYLNGNPNTPNPNYLSTRFKIMEPAKGSAFSLTPNTTDNYVYADEFVNWVNHNTTANQQVLYSLDNEPDLWDSTHSEIHPSATTYAELSTKSIQYATAIKNVSPNAIVLGAVNYGWEGYRNLQEAPDANGRDFQTYFLQQMHAADLAAGHRLVDSLDFHWYPEATGGGIRIDGSETTAAVSAARMQAPRSLWDPKYVETSWITTDYMPGQAIQLLPRTQALINANDPGMKMSISEYNYGAGDDISGGIAQADVLGIFGAQGVYDANWWDEGNGSRMVNAAARMYLNFDGHGGHFGDTSVSASVGNNSTTSIYAATDSTDPARLTIVLINKTSSSLPATVSLQNLLKYGTAQPYQFNATSSVVSGVVQISTLTAFTLANPQTLSFSMSPLSVTTLVLYPRAGDANGDGIINSDDYALVDRGYAKHLTGFSNGDFNHDGVITSADYLLLDTAYAQSGHSPSQDFLTQRESQFGSAYVTALLASIPEPALLTPIALALTYRRSRPRYPRIEDGKEASPFLQVRGTIWRC